MILVKTSQSIRNFLNCCRVISRLAASAWTRVAWVVASLACLMIYRASAINMTPSSFSIDWSSIWRLSIVSFLSANFVAWVFAELVDMPISMKKHSQSSDLMNPVCSAILNLWICSRNYCYEANRVAKKRIPLEEKEDYLSSIWLWTYRHVIAWAVTSNYVHMGTSLHGHYGSKCYYYSTVFLVFHINSINFSSIVSLFNWKWCIWLILIWNRIGRLGMIY